MANIEHLLDDIRKNKYCVDMKETFCNALNEANANVEEIELNVKKIKDEIISINANAELIDARCGEANLGDFNRKISSQLGTIVDKQNDILINVKDFGVLGNGTDETEKIQLAFDSIQRGQTLYFPIGDYKIGRASCRERV